MATGQQHSTNVLGDVSIQWGPGTLRVTVDFDVSQLSVGEVTRILDEIRVIMRSEDDPASGEGDPVAVPESPVKDDGYPAEGVRPADDALVARLPGACWKHVSGAVWDSNYTRIK